MGQMIEIPAGSSQIPAYLVKSEPVAKPVLVLHPWWGLNDFMRSLCDRLAAEGFTALAPDLYHGQAARTVTEAKALRDMLDGRQAAQEILAAADFLSQAGAPGAGEKKLGMLAFSLGAYLGMGILDKRPAAFAAVVLFYGGRRAKILKSRAAFQVHWAEKDPFVSAKDRQALAQHVMEAGLEASLFEYPGTGHWFFEENRPEAYHPASARLAWQRALDFLNEKLSA